MNSLRALDYYVNICLCHLSSKSYILKVYPKKVFVIIICGLINYRNQQNLILPTKGPGKINDGNSPVRTSTRSLRRQSLTGTEASGSDRSRRSSLGGKPTESSKQHLHRTDAGFLPHFMQLFHDLSSSSYCLLQMQMTIGMPRHRLQSAHQHRLQSAGCRSTLALKGLQ